VRAFFALWPGDGERRELHAKAVEVAARARGRAIAVEKLHLTLVFLGEIDERTVRCLTAGAGRVRAAQVDLAMSRIGCWPRAGVAWIAPLEVPDPLVRWQRELVAVAQECGVRPEARPWAPHLTLARRATQALPDERCAPVLLGIRELRLVRSDLASGRYEVIASWPGRDRG
jgi:2'-5' RNA ligase